MIKLRYLFAVVFLFIPFSSQVFANVITDVEEVNSRVGYLFEGADSRESWTHDLSDHAFTPGTALSASLSIEFSDDYDKPLNFIPEFTSIIVGVIDFQDDALWYSPVSDWSGSLGFNSLLSLNINGLLDVTVQGLIGDFLIGNSILEVTTVATAATAAAVAAVPEPASLFLIGMGMVGLGAARMKKKGKMV